MVIGRVGSANYHWLPIIVTVIPATDSNLIWIQKPEVSGPKNHKLRIIESDIIEVKNSAAVALASMPSYWKP